MNRVLSLLVGLLAAVIAPLLSRSEPAAATPTTPMPFSTYDCAGCWSRGAEAFADAPTGPSIITHTSTTEPAQRAQATATTSGRAGVIGGDLRALHRDGVRVGLRDASKSGGRTIDIRYPDGTTGEIHIE